MHPALREAASRAAARVAGSLSKPAARVVLAASGLLLLALLGRTAIAGAGSAPPLPSAVASAPDTMGAPGGPPPAPQAIPQDPAPTAQSPPRAGPRATADDPVILNTANVDDLRRLPGVGEKRATAIVALRTRLGGRFRAVEDLLKVKGIGRTTLRRLRPLVRLDPPVTPADAGAEAPR